MKVKYLIIYDDMINGDGLVIRNLSHEEVLDKVGYFDAYNAIYETRYFIQLVVNYNEIVTNYETCEEYWKHYHQLKKEKDES